MKNTLFSILCICILICSYTSIYAQKGIEIETGIVKTGYNNFRIPDNTGTKISLKDDLISKVQPYYRIKLSYTINSMHSFFLLYAPLRIESEGRLPGEVRFKEVIFPANTSLNATYKFNSYRLSYRYNFIQNSKLNIGIGFTAKIRDAQIALKSDNLSSKLDDFGFVPIFNFRLQYHFNDKIGILLDGDALAAKQGRAEDVLFAFTYKYSKNLEFKIGYRALEGGSDGSTVYTFALFHYANIGINISIN
jgi:hypothetical protein